MHQRKTEIPKLTVLLFLLLLVALAACTGEAGQPETTDVATATQQVVEGALATPGDGLCPEVPRPALVTNPSGGAEPFLVVMSLDGEMTCEVEIEGPVSNRQVVSAAGSLFYPVMDAAGQTVVLYRIGPDGSSQPLDFTATQVESLGSFTFTVSEDGRKIAWAVAHPGGSTGSLWVADSDGANRSTLLDGIALTVEEVSHYLQPVRFSSDNATLFYAIQPSRHPAVWTIIRGRYHKLFSVPAVGGAPELIFDCTRQGLFLCIGDFTPDGSAFAYTHIDQSVVHVMGRGGAVLNTLTPPAKDYVGMPTFGPTGELAFVSWKLSLEDGVPVPRPGHISLLEAPYMGDMEIVFSADGVANIAQWIDESHLAYVQMYGPTGELAIVPVHGEGQPVPYELPGAGNLSTVLE
jgi:hypothetical protein